MFDGVEVLDFAGPFEVYSRTRTEPGLESRSSDATAPFRGFSVAREAKEIGAAGGPCGANAVRVAAGAPLRQSAML